MSAHVIGHRSFSGAVTTNPLVFAHEVAWGTECLIVTIQSRSGAINTITYSGQSMTQVSQSGGSTDRASIYRLNNPPIGVANVSITFASSNGAINFAGGLNVVGVDISSPVRGTAAPTSANTLLEAMITSNKEDLVIASVLANSFTSVASDGFQTEHYNITSTNTGISAVKRGGDSALLTFTGSGAGSGFIQASVASITGLNTQDKIPKLDCFALDSALATVGHITPITDVEIKEAVDTIELCSFLVPRSALNYSLLTQSRIIGIRHSLQGPRFLGKIVSKKPYNDETGAEYAEVVCMGLAVETTKVSVRSGIILNAASATTAQAAALASNSGWTTSNLGSGYVSMTERIDNMTNWQALQEIGKVQNAAIRPVPLSRNIEFLRASRSNGLFLTNPKVGTLNNYISFINQVQGLEQGEVVNRYIPQAVDEGNIIFDLGSSNRSSPYTIQSMIQQGASVVDAINGTDTIQTGDTRVVLGDLTCTGRNRAIVMFFITSDALPGDISDAIVINGAVAKERFATAAFVGIAGANGTELMAVAIATNVPKGTVRLSVNLPFAAFNNSTVSWVCVALQDAPQTVDSTNYAVVDTSSSPSKNTSASVTGTGGTANKDLFLGAVATLGFNAATTTGTGQVRVDEALKMTVDYIIANGSGNAPFSWTLSGSDGWHCFSLKVKSVPLYYIEDATSQSSYGLSEVMTQDKASKLVTAQSSIKQAAANTLYDKYAYKLTNEKDPITGYDIDVGYIAGNALDWSVGDYFPKAIYSGYYESFTLTNLYCVSRTERFDENGNSIWTIVTNTKLKLPKSEEELFNELLSRIQNVEAVDHS